MARLRTDNQLSHQLETEEQKTSRSSKILIDRIHKDLVKLRIFNGEELAMDRYRCREVVVAPKDLIGLY